jgi:excisionase family DNA binding protein
MTTQTQSLECRALRPKEAARAYGVSRTLIYEWMKTGRLASVRLGGGRRRVGSSAGGGVEMSAPQMRSPGPRWRAGNRAEVIRNETSHSVARTEPEADFALRNVAEICDKRNRIAALVTSREVRPLPVVPVDLE